MVISYKNTKDSSIGSIVKLKMFNFGEEEIEFEVFFARLA